MGETSGGAKGCNGVMAADHAGAVYFLLNRQLINIGDAPDQPLGKFLANPQTGIGRKFQAVGAHQP